MRDFSWKYFAITGDVDAYMLYKEVNNQKNETELVELEEPVQVEMSE